MSTNSELVQRAELVAQQVEQDKLEIQAMVNKLDDFQAPSIAASKEDIKQALIESVNNKKFFARQLLCSDFFQLFPSSFGNGFVVVFVLVAGPPDGVFGGLVLNEEFVFGRTASVNAGHYVNSIHLGKSTFLKAAQTFCSLLAVQLIVRGVVDYLFHAGDTVLSQINFSHSFK